MKLKKFNNILISLQLYHPTSTQSDTPQTERNPHKGFRSVINGTWGFRSVINGTKASKQLGFSPKQTCNFRLKPS
jgi:hypothetical protein